MCMALQSAMRANVAVEWYLLFASAYDLMLQMNLICVSSSATTVTPGLAQLCFATSTNIAEHFSALNKHLEQTISLGTTLCRAFRKHVVPF